MKNRIWQTSLLALCALLFCVAPARSANKEEPTAHVLTVSSVDQTIDRNGRKIFVAHLSGELPGILTMVLNVEPGGAVTGGEWALNVSYQVFGRPNPAGDGDASERLVQLGHFKGTVVSGTAAVLPNRITTSASVQLMITGATVNFAGITSGSGSFIGADLNVSSISSGTFTLIY